ncbi:MAG: lipoprotein [Thiobacillaceae bacterium]
MKLRTLLTVSLLTSCLLAGCGSKGPLYLPTGVSDPKAPAQLNTQRTIP